MTNKGIYNTVNILYSIERIHIKVYIKVHIVYIKQAIMVSLETIYILLLRANLAITIRLIQFALNKEKRKAAAHIIMAAIPSVRGLKGNLFTKSFSGLLKTDCKNKN